MSKTGQILFFTGLKRRAPAPDFCPHDCKWLDECKRRPRCDDGSQSRATTTAQE